MAPTLHESANMIPMNDSAQGPRNEQIGAAVTREEKALAHAAAEKLKKPVSHLLRTHTVEQLIQLGREASAAVA